ncbi:HARBI1 family protein [Actinomadura hibisca]|uniref:HARBI1 family protein n=1 Tax=Actinomadura hibisca TaxID=68565 RepID=UPI0035A25D15
MVRRHRAKISTRWRRLHPGRQALLVLIYLHKGETYAEMAARAPKLRAVLRKAAADGHPYLVVDGTLILIDRVKADRPFYSGKHKRHGMNLQVIATPEGDIVWVSGALPGSTHDLAAVRIWSVLRELEAAGLVVLADKGYHGVKELVTPYKGKGKPPSQKDANRAHARLRGPGERANAQLKSWRVLRKLRCCPWKAELLAKAIHLLQVRGLQAT